MEDDVVSAEALVSADVLATIKRQADLRGISPEELLERLVADELWQRMLAWTEAYLGERDSNVV